MTDREFSTQLDKEVRKWVDDGIVDAEVAERISDLYKQSASNRRSRAGALVALLGAFLIGAGVIAFIASTWSDLGPINKLALTIGLLMTSGASGYWLRYGPSTLKGTGNALLFLMTPLFGAAVFLTAETFHMPIETPELMFLWAAGVIPIAIVTESRAQWVVALIILLVAVSSTKSAGMSETISWMLVVQFCFSLALHGGSALLPVWDRTKGMKQVTEVMGLLLMQAMLIPLGFLGTFDSILTRPVIGFGGNPLAMPTVMVAAVTNGICTWAYVRSKRTQEDRIRLGLYWVSTLVVMLPVLIGGLADYGWGLITNLYILMTIVCLIVHGFRERNAAEINIAVISFVIQVICRYCELFWDQISPEFFFTVLGVMLVVGGMFLERSRRRILSDMTRPDAGVETL